MPITAKLDEFGKPAWIALTILGFMVWWPLGLAILAFAIGSGRMGCGHGYGHWQHKMDRMQGKMDRLRERIRRLEDEQREFHEFLDRLRMAKDKSEFDQFMADRRNRPHPDTQPQT